MKGALLDSRNQINKQPLNLHYPKSKFLVIVINRILYIFIPHQFEGIRGIFGTAVCGTMAVVCLLSSICSAAPPTDTQELFEQYCFNCHDEDEKKGDLDLSAVLDKSDFDGNRIFENLITGKMPPSNKKQPTAAEREKMLAWLASRQPAHSAHDFRRISRHEFVTSVNDLLGTDIDLVGEIPEDRGTYDFDTDRRIQLTSNHKGTDKL